ncbi:MAG: Hsp20/alpha crystallin family protein [Bacteroidota bacterium]
MYSFVKNNNERNRILYNEFPSFFDDVFTKDFLNKSAKRSAFHTVPSVNIKETDKSFELDFAAPGLEKKNFKIELVDDKLVISAQQEVATEEKNENADSFTRKEFNYNSFSRSFVLPEKMVDKESINASYENGILKVMIPKKEKDVANQNREIQIS